MPPQENYTQASQKKLENKKQKISSGKIMLICFLASFGNICLGYSSVCISALESLLQQANGLTDEVTLFQLSISTCSLNTGALIGIFKVNQISGAMSYKRVQRKLGILNAMILSDLLGILFLSIQLIDLSVYYLVVGRFCYGMCVAVGVAILPGYLNKIAQHFNRVDIQGTIGSLNQIQFVFGIVIAYLMGYSLPTSLTAQFNIQSEARWRIYLGLPILFFLVRLISFRGIEYFREVSDCKLYTESLSLVPQKAYQTDISSQGKRNEEIIKIHYSDKVLNKKFRSNKQQQTETRRQILVIAIVASNQFSCINGIFYYARQLMNSITDNDQQLSKLLMLGIALGQFFAAVGSGYFIDKYGRRVVFLRGQILIIMILILGFLTTTKTQYIEVAYKQFFIAVLVNLHVIIFNLSLGPLGVFYSSEIVEDLTLGLTALKIFSLFFAVFSGFLIHKIGIGKMFLIFGIISFALHVFLRKTMIQTKGLTKEQLYQKFDSHQTGRKQKKRTQQQKHQSSNISFQPQSSHLIKFQQ